MDHKGDGVKFAYPPLAWTGARLKWEVRDLGGNKVFRKTLDRVLFQRAITIFGDPESSGYTIQADVMSDSARRGRSMGNIGVMNQRYFIALIGNQQKLERLSNLNPPLTELNAEEKDELDRLKRKKYDSTFKGVALKSLKGSPEAPAPAANEVNGAHDQEEYLALLGKLEQGTLTKEQQDTQRMLRLLSLTRRKPPLA